MRARNNPRTLLFEAAIVVAIAIYYIGGNLLFEVSRPVAIENARDIIELQDRAGLNVEGRIQQFFDPHPVVTGLLVFFYAGPHFLLTYGFLLWVYWKRFAAYANVRNAFLLFTGSAFTFQWLFPVAPPRMVPELGLGDTVTQSLPINGETPWISLLVNDVAAVPSIHTGWSLLVAILLIRLTSSPWRWLWLLYPGAIMTSVLATANHFVWDLVTAFAWLGLSEILHLGLLVRWFEPVFHPLPRPAPVSEDEE